MNPNNVDTAQDLLSSQNWPIFGIAAGVVLIVVFLVVVIGRKNKAPLNVFFWILLVIFLAALGFTLYKLYEYSAWIYVGPMDWMTFGIAAAIALITWIGLIIRAGRRDQPAGMLSPESVFCTACGAKNKMGNRFCFSCGAPVYTDSNNAGETAAITPGSLPGNGEPFPVNTPAAGRPKNALPKWVMPLVITLCVAAPILGVAIGMQDIANNGSNSSNSSIDPCAEVKSKLESWDNCDCSNTQGDSVHCIVKARDAANCYIDSHGIRMCTEGIGDGFVPKVCVPKCNK